MHKTPSAEPPRAPQADPPRPVPRGAEADRLRPRGDLLARRPHALALCRGHAGLHAVGGAAGAQRQARVIVFVHICAPFIAGVRVLRHKLLQV